MREVVPKHLSREGASSKLEEFLKLPLYRQSLPA
jgi:hypothetical protein